MVIPPSFGPVPEPLPVLFMGSPAFAVPILAALVSDERFRVTLVVTQPPKRVGRGNRIARSAVHEVAEQWGLRVWTPERLRGAEVLKTLRDAGAALHVVAAYGKILRRDVLDIPAFGTLNVHASLLPAYRGASPITAAILDGVAQTGVTIMLLDEGLDTGAILARSVVNISQHDTTRTLTETLAHAGANLLIPTAWAWVHGEITPKSQDATQATMTHTLTKDDGRVDFADSPARLARMERAYSPWPGVYAFLGGSRVILRELTAIDESSAAPSGTILAVNREGMYVAAGGRILRIGSVQPEGKAAMSPEAFARGRSGLVGMRFNQDSLQAMRGSL